MAYQINIANREINPRVINFFTFENQVTTLEFTLDNYIYDEVDLRNYKAYAVTSIKGSVDLTELEMVYDDVDDKLILTWNVGDYTLTQDGAIVYQITFKQNENDGEDSAVWYSYKAIMINRGSVDADHKIVAEYPTIMKQWLDRMDELYGEVSDIRDTAIADITDIQAELERYATEFTNSIFYIDYNEAIPVEDRLKGRLYYQWTDAEKTKGRFEDPDGVALVPEAKGGLPMFAPVWSDHLYNDASYLRADNFSWHNSGIYVSAYEKLLKEYNNEASVEEVENGITYKLSPNGFKIADASQEEAINELYLSDEKAWYYILDTENGKFKLPREKKVDGKYLYFFVGVYEREEEEINLGEMTEVINQMNAKTDRLLEEMIGEIEEAKDNAIAEIEDVEINKSTLNNPFFLGMSQYFESEPNNTSWLLSDGEFHDGTVYKGFYEWLVNIYNGTETVEGVSVKANTEEYSDYDYVINTEDSTFRLPIYDGSESINGNKQVDLTVGASGTVYTAPANGLVVAGGYSSTLGGYFEINQGTLDFTYQSAVSNGYGRGFIPVKKGNFEFRYEGFNVQYFRFIYATGNGSLYFYVGETVVGANIIDYTKQLTEAANNEIARVTEATESELAKITEAGQVITSYQQPLVTIAETSGTVALSVNNIYTMEINADTEFTLPETVNTAYFNQIKVMAKIVGTPVITWGTSYFVNKSAPELEEGVYDLYFDYDNHLAGWVVGAISKGA